MNKDKLYLPQKTLDIAKKKKKKNSRRIPALIYLQQFKVITRQSKCTFCLIISHLESGQ